MTTDDWAYVRVRIADLLANEPSLMDKIKAATSPEEAMQALKDAGVDTTLPVWRKASGDD